MTADSSLPGQGLAGSLIDLDAPLIAIIEDDRRIATMIRNFLEGVGYRVACFERGREGLTAAARIRPSAIILDLLLPDLTGREVLTALKANPQTKEIPVIITSAIPHTLSPTECRLAHRVLPKPFGLVTLLKTLDGIARGKAPALP